MNFRRKTRKGTPSIIIVALIDVLIVVLIFLMVTTTFKKPEPAVELALPESSQASSGQPGTAPLVITVAKETPHLYLEDQPMTPESLETELRSRMTQEPSLQVSLKADREAPFGIIIQIMDLAQKLGLSQLKAYADQPAP